MKICGIICEYNPLHSGHLYHLDFTKRQGDVVVCVMSGNFTQRGEIACMDKYVRAKHAIYSGADIVLELPTIFATSSAEHFAYGGIKILNAIGADILSFGSECGDINLLTEYAEMLNHPTEEFNLTVKHFLSKGMSYPVAISNSASQHFAKPNILNKPNNILAIEFIRQIKMQNSKMTPITIEREDNYNENNLRFNYPSATAIRHLFETNQLDTIGKFIPDYVYEDYKKQIRSDYEQLIYAYLNTLNADSLKSISRIEGVTEGLENRILANCAKGNYSLMVEAIKTKRYTLTKLQRIFLAILLGKTKNLLTRAKKIRPYTRVLAINKDKLNLLSYLAKCKISLVPDISKEQNCLYELDLKASNIYASLAQEVGNKDLTMGLQKV
ncbi:MAG: nucleotidyltransferase family protein [Clostridia bacterium]